MSILSLLGYNGSSSQSSYDYTTASANTLVEKLIADKAQASGSSATVPVSSVSISDAAFLAAAEKADNAKGFATLSGETRRTLDAQYAAAETAGQSSVAPHVAQLSGRALSSIILNQTNGFSSREIAAAKSELNARTRADFQSAISGGLSLTALGAYNQALVTQYDGISAEERAARGWSDRTRAEAAAFVSQSSLPSLFDQLD